MHNIIEQPALASQQRGAEVVVRTLLQACRDEERMLPVDRREEIAQHGDHLRAAIDYVASLTERDALALYRRVIGVELGSLAHPFE